MTVGFGNRDRTLIRQFLGRLFHKTGQMVDTSKDSVCMWWHQGCEPTRKRLCQFSINRIFAKSVGRFWSVFSEFSCNYLICGAVSVWGQENLPRQKRVGFRFRPAFGNQKADRKMVGFGRRKLTDKPIEKWFFGFRFTTNPDDRWCPGTWYVIPGTDVRTTGMHNVSMGSTAMGVVCCVRVLHIVWIVISTACTCPSTSIIAHNQCPCRCVLQSY